MDNQKAVDVINRIAAIKDLLESQKPLYEELDELTEELQEVAEVNQTLKTIDGRYVTLRDNFSEKNAVWRPACVRRFEAELLTEEEMEKKVSKESKKLAKK